MEFGSAGRDGPGFSSSSPSSSSSSPQYKPGSTAAGAGPGPLIFDGPDTKLELMPKNEDGFGSMVRSPPAASVEKEHMFDKVVTPSDVGKLNRLVIPKQHAEKYFPLDSAANEKGLLLNFEDRNGKPWRFRYSYWNSSQSYVMTKGWSRFVKEKKLDAGDVVSFHRGLGEVAKDRLFIDWRRRPDAPDHYHIHGHHHHHNHPPGAMFHTQAGMFHPRSVPWSPALMRPPPSMNYGTMNHLHHNVPYRNSYGAGSGGQSYAYGAHISQAGGPVFYVRSPTGTGQTEPEQLRGGGGGDTMVFDSVPVGHGKAGAAAAAGGKRLRLFGVNMECPNSEGHEESNAASQVHHPLQLRLYNGTPIAGISTVDYLNKGKASMTLNFDI